MPKRRQTPGRPSKLTVRLQAAICKKLEIAVPEKYAAEANGIDESTFHDWMRQGVDGREPYARFRQAVKQSRAQAVCNLLFRALAGGKGSAAAMWLLERLFPDAFRLRTTAGATPDADPLWAERDVAPHISDNPEARRKLNEAIANLAAGRGAQRRCGFSSGFFLTRFGCARRSPMGRLADRLLPAGVRQSR